MLAFYFFFNLITPSKLLKKAQVNVIYPEEMSYLFLSYVIFSLILLLLLKKAQVNVIYPEEMSYLFKFVIFSVIFLLLNLKLGVII